MRARSSFPPVWFRAAAIVIVMVSVPSGLLGQIVTFTFGAGASPTTVASVGDANLSSSVFSGNTGSPATGGGTPVYSAGSGGSYFTATSWTGSAPGGNYFEFTLTPAEGYSLTITSLSFGYRSTGTGPTAFSFRASSDAFSTSLASGTLTNDGVWHASGTNSITLSSLGSATTFRLYASGASASGGTLRVDDVTLAGSLAAVPEPSIYAVMLGLGGLAGVVWRKHRINRLETKGGDNVAPGPGG